MSAGLIYGGRIKTRQGLKQSWDSLNQTLGGKFSIGNANSDPHGEFDERKASCGATH